MIAICVLILTGSCIMGYFVVNPDRGSDTIEVDLGKGGNVDFEDLAMLPGESTEYKIKLKGEVEAECDITLKFKEKGDNNTLKNFVYVRIEYEDEVVCDELLADVLDGKRIKLDGDFRDGKRDIIKITYYMPIEVENEAENAEADFSLQISVVNEE